MPDLHPFAAESARLIWFLCAVGAVALVIVVSELYRSHRK